MRNTKSYASAFVVGGLALVAAAGCASRSSSETVRERDTSDGPRSERSDRRDVVVIHDAPPPPRTDVVIEQSSSSQVWVPGYWRPGDKQWVWTPGHWESPAPGVSVWVPPSYEQRDGGWTYVEGHWR